MVALSKQTFQNFEVIIVNDGKSYLTDEHKNLRITWIDNDENLGGTKSRNRALHYAAGEYIVPIDDDDLILPTHLELLMQHRDDASLIYSDAEIICEDRSQERKILQRLPYAFDFDSDVQRWCLTVIPSGMCYKKSLHHTLGFFDDGFRNSYWDWDWMLRVIPAHPIKRVPYATVLYFFDQNGDNASSGHPSRSADLAKLATKHALGELETANFLTILQNPSLHHLKRETKILWNGV